MANIPYPGQYTKNASVAQAAPEQTVPNIPVPGTHQNAAPKAQSNYAPQVKNAVRTEPPTVPLAWLFISRKGQVKPGERIIFFVFGLLLWGWGGFLTSLVVGQMFPAMRSNAFLSLQTLASYMVSSIFMIIQIYIWKSGHSWFKIGMAFVAFAMDIALNVAGYMALFSHKELILNGASGFILLVACLTATIPEWLISEATQ